MRGKKARGRSNRSERGAAAAQPSPALTSASHDAPEPEPRTQQHANRQEATAAPTHDSAQATGAQLAKKLQGFVLGTLSGIKHANDLVVADRFASDVATIAAAAERGNAQALLYMLRMSYVHGCNEDITKWSCAAAAQENTDALLYFGLGFVGAYLAPKMKNIPERDLLKNTAVEYLQNPVDRGSATAQYALGMLIYCAQCDSGAKADLLDAARWIRKAAMQSLMDAQYELGEMFRHGVFCDHIYMRFARKYIRRASVQGHVEAITRMKELRSCVMCGADDAMLACSLCHQARYCDSWCSEKHWCEGGGVGGCVSGGVGARHKDTCPRTHSQ